MAGCIEKEELLRLLDQFEREYLEELENMGEDFWDVMKGRYVDEDNIEDANFLAGKIEAIRELKRKISEK
jgi:hypothetical protein